MPPRPMAQSQCCSKTPNRHRCRNCQQDVQMQLLQQMVQWMQAVALAINKEARDEQDHR